VIGFCGLPAIAAQEKPAPKQPAGPAPVAAAQVPDIGKEAMVVDKLTTRIRLEADGTGTRQTTSRTRVLADAGVKELAVLTFTYTASNQQVDIGYVRVVKPDGSVVITPDYNVQDMPADVTREAPMYSDIHQKHVAVKGLGVGDTLEDQVTVQTLKPEVPGHFWLEYSFEKNLIVLDEQLDLDLPADKFVNVASTDLQPTITTANGRKHYHWVSSNLARPDPDAPPKSTKHWKPSVQVTTFTSWEQVGAWYRSLQQEPLALTPAIQAKATELTKGLTSDEDKVRAIFNDVALHIHYVGLEFGIGRYQPHPADDVLSNQYGDCKDKHTLLASLLKASGVEAWPVLISSGRELDSATASPAQFDHVITLVPLSGQMLWMDSTEEVAPVSILMATLRDKQALAIPAVKPAYLERTPANLPFVQSARFKIDGSLSDQGVFSAHIVQSYHGDAELFMRVVLRQVPQSQWKQYMQNLSNATGFGGEVTNPQVSEIEQTSQPLQFSYDYTREKYGEWDNHRISPPMPPVGWELAPGVKVRKPADEPELGSPGEMVYSSSVQLPKGWAAFPPKSVDLSEDWAEYHSSYKVSGSEFMAERRLLVKRDKVPLDQWDKYLAFRRAIYDDEIRMTPIFSGEAAVHFPSSVHSYVEDRDAGPPEVVEPLRDAAAILEAETPASKDELKKALDVTRKAVDAAEAESLTLSPDDVHSLYGAETLSYVWTMLGWAALECNDFATAENYLRAAWELSQDRMAGYQLGRLLEAKGNKAAAAHVYQLASVTGVSNAFREGLSTGYDIQSRIRAGYVKMTGNALTATSLNHGQYNGSLRAELDKGIEIHGFAPTSKLNGQALFTVAYEAGKPVKARFLQGDKGVAAMASSLEGHRFPMALPSGSKARVLREARLICAPYGGCDAYMLLPTAIQIPYTTTTKDVTPSNAPAGTKVVRIPIEP